MFDPTAFENMKVVIEGELYDSDLTGEIRIKDRNDIFNSAKLSRRYDITFTDQKDKKVDVWCTFILEAGLANLAAELLPIAHSAKLAGCQIQIEFSFVHKENISFAQNIERVLKEIWGQDRIINVMTKRSPFSGKNEVTYVAAVTFNRLIYEDQVDDLTAMVDYMIDSIAKLRAAI